MNSKKEDIVISIPIGEIKVELRPSEDTPNIYVCGWITSALKEVCEVCHNPKCNFDCYNNNDKLDELQYSNISEYVCLKSDLEDKRVFNHRIDAIESLILAHAIAGVNIMNPDYVEGVRVSVDACANN